MLHSAGVTDVRGFTDPRLVVSACLELDPDLVLLDLRMPDMDGVAVLNALRARLPADAFVPVVILTADASAAARERALDAGASDFVTKPFDRIEVLLRVRNLLETRRLYTQAQRRNERLQARVNEHLAHERQIAVEHRLKSYRIRQVLAGHGLSMVFQPIVELDTRHVVGAEALARFAPSPLRPPNEWFSEADEVGLGTELELLAVDHAVAQLPMLPADSFLSFNASPATATHPQLQDRLAAIPGRRVVLELTEHHRVDDYEALWPALDELRTQGVRVAVDDAGTGYSGLQHILRLQPDIVKLDLELTKGIHADPARKALASSLVDFVGEIGAQLVAEGIESRDELDVLRRLGVPWGQGFYWGRPAPLPLTKPAELHVQ
jgi:EAL domain-containing protein (putative c-di-GMP-specific phosphodiesterase class I)